MTNQNQQNQNRSNNQGNFKNDPERAREAGKKGGQHSSSGGRRPE